MITNMGVAILEAVKESLEAKGFNPPVHLYAQPDQFLPGCSHSFGSVNHIVTSLETSYGLDVSNSDLIRGVHLFEVIVADCIGKPPVLSENRCGSFGELPVCGHDLSVVDWDPDPLTEECKPVEIVDGEVVWPYSENGLALSHQTFLIWEKQEALREGLTVSLCAIYHSCYGPKVRSRAKLLKIESWNQGSFSGSKCTLAMYVNS